MAITTVERVRGFRAGLSGAIEARVALRLAAAEAHVIGKLGYDPAQVIGAVRTSGTGTQILPLPGAIPITAVSALTVDGVSWTVLNPGAAEAYQDVWIPDHGRWIEARASLVWTRGRGNIAVTRTAGYPAASMPADLQDVTALLALLILDEDTRLGMGQRTLGEGSIEQLTRNWSDYELFTSTVNRYRRFA